MSAESVVIDDSLQLPPLQASPSEIKYMLEVIHKHILPKTTSGVDLGNKVFGAAVLSSDLSSVVLADTNSEMNCPIFHGEVKVIYEWSKLIEPSKRGPAAQSSIFLSTHEPCCMCISSILWAGFTKVFYFFPYASTTSQGIPHDINTMHELWGVNSYRKQNKFLSTTCIMDLIDSLEDGKEKEELKMMKGELIQAYDELSQKYHKEKVSNIDNSLVLG
jgi:tRNA(Arg) A34 adenosine deaminase TadA